MFQGQILLDRNDIKTVKLRWLRQQIGLVSQEPALFAISIKVNILLGRPDASLVQIEEAARVFTSPEMCGYWHYSCSLHYLSINRHFARSPTCYIFDVPFFSVTLSYANMLPCSASVYGCVNIWNII